MAKQRVTMTKQISVTIEVDVDDNAAPIDIENAAHDSPDMPGPLCWSCASGSGDGDWEAAFYTDENGIEHTFEDTPPASLRTPAAAEPPVRATAVRQDGTRLERCPRGWSLRADAGPAYTWDELHKEGIQRSWVHWEDVPGGVWVRGSDDAPRRGCTASCDCERDRYQETVIAPFVEIRAGYPAADLMD